MTLNNRDLEEILKLLDGTDIEMFEIKEDNTRIKIVRDIAYQNHPIKTQPVTVKKEPTSGIQEDTGKGDYTVKSYMVGTFYRSNEQDGKPLVKEGDKISIDQPLCVIECMKNINLIKLRDYHEEFKAKGGIVHKILVENNSAVQVGKPLFLIKPEE